MHPLMSSDLVAEHARELLAQAARARLAAQARLARREQTSRQQPRRDPRSCDLRPPDGDDAATAPVTEPALA